MFFLWYFFSIVFFFLLRYYHSGLLFPYNHMWMGGANLGTWCTSSCVLYYVTEFTVNKLFCQQSSVLASSPSIYYKSNVMSMLFSPCKHSLSIPTNFPLFCQKLFLLHIFHPFLPLYHCNLSHRDSYWTQVLSQFYTKTRPSCEYVSLLKALLTLMHIQSQKTKSIRKNKHVRVWNQNTLRFGP